MSVIVLSGTVRAQKLSLDTTFQPPLFTLSVQAARVIALSNGQALVFSGVNALLGFDRFNGMATGNLVRLNTDGSVDTSFVLDPALRAKSITSVAPMINGQYILGTLFVSNSVSYAQIYRLNANGGVDTTFNPGPEAANTSLFRAVAVQTDGKVLAGSVSEVTGSQGLQFNGHTYTGLLRLNADGSIDTGFNVTLGNDGVELPGITADGGIQLQTDGKIVIAGGFSSVNGTTQANVARLDTDGSLDTSFVPSGFSVTSGSSSFQQIFPTRSAVIQPDGKVVVAGRFNQTASAPFTSQAIVRLNTDGSLDTTFRTPVESEGEGFLVRLQQDGKLLLGEVFDGFHRYNPDGSLDTAFNTNSGVVGFASGFGVLPNGQVLVAGDVNTAGLLRLNADGTPDTTFSVSVQADSAPSHVALLHNGTALAAGDFDTVAGQSRAGLALLNANGSLKAAKLPSTFLVDISDAPDFLVQSDDNKILLFGNTPADADGNTGFTYLRLNANLSVDTTLTADASVTPFQSVLYQPGNGYLLSAGSLNADSYIEASGGLPGDPTFFLNRLGLQGSPDPNFVPDIDTTTIFNGRGPGNLADATLYSGNDNALAVQPDGKILYQYFDNTEAYRLVRLNADGSLDSSFRIGSAPPTSPAFTGFTDSVDLGAGAEQAMEVGAASLGISGAFVQSNGRILIYGDFATYNGQTANGLARLKANGKLDTKFNTGAGPQGPGGAVGSAYAVTSAQELPNGQVLLVGSFTSFNGVAQPGIVRLNANGSVDTSFTASGIVSKQASIGPDGLGGGGSRLAPTNNGTYLLTGNYTTTNGAGTGSFFRLFGGVSTTPTPVKPIVPKPLPSAFDGSVPFPDRSQR